MKRNGDDTVKHYSSLKTCFRIGQLCAAFVSKSKVWATLLRPASPQRRNFRGLARKHLKNDKNDETCGNAVIGKGSVRIWRKRNERKRQCEDSKLRNEETGQSRAPFRENHEALLSETVNFCQETVMKQRNGGGFERKDWEETVEGRILSG